MKTVRLSLLDIYIGVICIFPIATMLVDGGVWNKLMFGVLLISHIGMLLLRPIKGKTFLLLLLMVLHYAFALNQTEFPMDNTNLLFYFPFFLMYTYYMCDNMSLITNWFVNHKRYVNMIVILWSVLVGISVFLPSSYHIREGGHYYFGSFCGSIFRLGPSAVFVQVLILIKQIMYQQRKAFFYMVLPMYSFLMGSARTYLVVGFCLFIISWYIFCKKKSVFWGTLIPLSFAVLALVSVSAMGDKIAFTLDENQYGDLLFRITSGRNVIWDNLLTAWRELGLMRKMLGAGIEFTSITAGHWAHNDFVEILCSFGVMGLLQYLFSMRGLYRIAYANTQVPFAIKICAFMVWFFNAFFNMHYVYFCAMLCYPFLLFALRYYFEKNPMKLKWSAETNETTNRIHTYI